MKSLTTLTGFTVMVMAGVFVTTAMAAPKGDTPPDDWELLLNNVDVIIDKAIGIEAGVAGVQTSVDGVQGSVDDLTDKVITISEIGINGLQTSVDGVQSSVNGLIIDVANVHSSVNAVGGKVDGVHSSVNAVGVKVDGVQSSVDAVGGKVDIVEGKVDGVQSSVDAVGGKVDVVDGKVVGVQNSVNAVGGKVDAVDGKVGGVQSSVDAVGVKVDGVQGGVNDLKNSLLALESVIADLVAGGDFTEHPNGDELVVGVKGSNVFDRWTYGDYADPRHVSLTLQARGVDSTDFVGVWVRTHPSDSTDTDKNIRYYYESGDFNGPSWVQQIEFDAIEWGIQINKNDFIEDFPTSQISLTWAATVSAPDNLNGAQSVFSDGSNTFNRTVNGNYAAPRHVSLTLQARGMDDTDFVGVWVRTHPSDSTDTDKNIRYYYESGDFNGTSEVQQIEFDAIEWGIQINKNDQYDASPTPKINLTWAATLD